MWRDGDAPLRLRLQGRPYHLTPPPVPVLLDIAADYAWRELVPGCFAAAEREEITARVQDRDDGMSSQLLHYAAQGVGTRLYGWPMFSAATICVSLKVGEPVFRLWAAQNGVFPHASWSAADWCAAGVAWMLGGCKTEVAATALMARLQLPRVLDPDVPGVTPEWIAASER